MTECPCKGQGVKTWTTTSGTVELSDIYTKNKNKDKKGLTDYDNTINIYYSVKEELK